MGVAEHVSASRMHLRCGPVGIPRLHTRSAGRALRLARPGAVPCSAAVPPSPAVRRTLAAAMSSGASVSALQRLVEQLKLEAGVERIKVSQAAAELQQYCMQNACKDALLVGVPAGSNPFREPRSCALL